MAPNQTSGLVRAAVGLAFALLLTLFLVPGCGSGGASSPEELFEEIVRLSGEGNWDAIYALQHPKAQENWAKHLDEVRKTYNNNPHPSNENLPKRLNVSPQELNSLSPLEIWRRHHAGKDRYLQGSKIVGKLTDPRNPDDVIVKWHTGLGEQFEYQMRARWDDGRYYLMDLTAAQE